MALSVIWKDEEETKLLILSEINMRYPKRLKKINHDHVEITCLDVASSK